MRKQMKLVVLLLTVVSSVFSFASTITVPTVKATYVEGTIYLDTVWTLVDSPIVLLNNVTVDSAATLTIEPGVEVRFGGNFSLIVNGGLIADGAKDKMIRFTSNNPTPTAGYWGTITFDGAQSSSLTYCVLEYATDGVRMEAGSLNLKISIVKSCSGDGIVINGGSAVIESNEITDNQLDGIHIAGGSQVNVTNNVIESNGNGMELTKDLTTALNIEQNKISHNSQNGIVLAADAYDRTLILNNTLSENNYGFYVSSSANTNITRNYILHNVVGIYYENGTGHEAHFNDVYGNGMGMDVSSQASVNAGYNYWGDESGPKHAFLNPYGEGNPVGGDGVNLDFIFFLSEPIDYQNKCPKAKLWADKTLVTPNQPVTFVGTDSYDQDPDGRVNLYSFDFNDANSVLTTLSVFDHAYSATGNYTASLRVVDDFNTASDNIDRVNITVRDDLVPLRASITLSKDTVDYNSQVVITVYVWNGISPIAGANVTLFSVKGGSFASGLTNSTGYFTAVFAAPNVTELTDVRIIARASKAGYADGSTYKYLKVLPPLIIQVTADPSPAISEENSTVTVSVTAGGEPVPNANVDVSCDIGQISPTTLETDSSGKAIFVFLSPLVETQNPDIATINVSAIKTGYVKGEAKASISVIPKVLLVQIAAEPSEMFSEDKVNVTAHVTYEHDMTPVEEATVLVESQDGSSFTATALTDADGNVVFSFTAPAVSSPLEVTISASASKTGYIDAQNATTITVDPKVFNVEFESVPQAMLSDETVALKVNVTCDGAPVANASLALSTDYGSLSTAVGNTSSDGTFAFKYLSPATSIELSAIIKVNVSKVGFATARNQTTVSVLPKTTGETGWPLTTILLIVIPIAILVIVAVLIKLKVISFSKEENE